MSGNKKGIGVFVGLFVFASLMLLPIRGLSGDGQLFLALTLTTVVFWATQVTHPGFVAGLYLALLVILRVAEPAVVFSPWMSSTIYFIIGAYLIAAAVKKSGLGERIAMHVISRYISSFRSIIISIFALSAFLSLLIPNSFARSFIIMSVMKQVIDNAKLPKKDAIIIGFSVFASSIPVSMIFLTGEGTINLMIVQLSGVNVSWLQWLLYMGPAGIVATLFTLGAILVLFKPEQEVTIDKAAIRQRLVDLGKLTSAEVRVIVWLVVAILVWMTDSLHGIDIGWATLALTMAMGLPFIGNVVNVKDWSEVPIHVLIFLTAAVAIGRVGEVTGASAFIAEVMFPATVPQNMFLMAVLIIVIAVTIHMLMGSVMAVLNVVIPSVLIFTAPLGINPIIPVFIVYVAVFCHYLFPFHNISILIGVGEENGLYSDREVRRMSLPLLAMVFIVVLGVLLPWWKLLGLY